MTALENEELRKATREVLAARFPVALGVSAIRHRIESATVLDFRITDEAVVSALEFLAGLLPAQAQQKDGELGASVCWAATSYGVQAWERSRRN